MRIRQPARNRNDDKQVCGEDRRRQGLFRLVGVTSSRQPKFRVLFPIIDRKQAGSEIARAWEILKYPPRPCCLGQSLATISTSKRCRAPFASFVTAHTGNLLPFCCQYARKLLPIAPQTIRGDGGGQTCQKGREKKKRIRAWRAYPLDFVVVRPAGIEPAAYCLGESRYYIPCIPQDT